MLEDTSPIELLNDILESLRRSGQFNRVPLKATKYYAHIPLGMSGVHYAIAVKRASVKVGIYFETSQAKLNEEMFKSLVGHKDEIERRVGRSMIWRSEPGLKRTFVESEVAANLGARALRDRTSQMLLHLDNVCRPIILGIIGGAA